MNEGLLWFDNNPSSTFEEKLYRLIQFYENKFGEKPENVFVYRTNLQSTLLVEGVTINIIPKQWIIQNHFFASKVVPAKQLRLHQED